MENEKLNFINNEFPKLLKKLTPETPRKWGLMSPQQMVEHLTDYVRIASGKNPVKVITPDANLEAYKRFLHSDKQFRPETKNPLNEGPPNPVRNNSLAEAIAEYLSEMKDFYEVFANEPDKRSSHPSFGNLNSEDWLQMQYKHLIHHARQFGLVEQELGTG